MWVRRETGESDPALELIDGEPTLSEDLPKEPRIDILAWMSRNGCTSTVGMLESDVTPGLPDGPKPGFLEGAGYLSVRQRANARGQTVYASMRIFANSMTGGRRIPSVAMTKRRASRTWATASSRLFP